MSNGDRIIMAALSLVWVAAACLIVKWILL